ncbi:Uncharacterised protein [Chlamydia trachomatis]|nr:Uncharacterised protein [Chlamydia trachomatis]CRH25876.1 Uncharacterised protein [Chlamydia trachomatis]SYV91244.1 Uncharacterised protein [Mesomycoplasma hyorhinis]
MDLTTKSAVLKVGSNSCEITTAIILAFLIAITPAGASSNPMHSLGSKFSPCAAWIKMSLAGFPFLTFAGFTIKSKKCLISNFSKIVGALWLLEAIANFKFLDFALEMKLKIFSNKEFLLICVCKSFL